MGARCAGVVCTETTGSFSFSSLLQPVAMQSITAMAVKKAAALQRDARVVMVVEVMELLEPPSAFANWPKRRDSARLRRGRRRWLARKWSGRPRLPERWLPLLCSGECCDAGFLLTFTPRVL